MQASPGRPSIAAFLLLLAAAPAVAQDLRLPPPPLEQRRGYEATSWLTLKPYLRQGAFFSSNIFALRNSERVSDTVYYTIPGLDAYAEASDESWVELGYAPTILLYHHEGNLDTVEHRLRYVGATGVGKLAARSSGTATWAAFNSDPQFVGRVRNFQGALNLDLEHPLTDVLGVRGNTFATQSTNFPSALHPTNTAEWGASTALAITPNLDNDITLLVSGSFREIHYTDHKARLADLSLAGAAGGVQLDLPELLRVDLLAGVEFPWVKKRNALSSTVDIDPSPLVNLTVAWLPVRDGELLVSVRHRLDASSRAAYQRSTTVSATVSYHLPHDLTLRAIASGTLQQPRRSTDLRLQSYQAILAWQPWEHLELGCQAGYTRSSLQNGGFEAFTIGAALTLKL